MRGFIVFCAFFFFAINVGGGSYLNAHPFLKNDRIAFYGDSNTDWGSYHKHIQEYFHKFYPDQNLQSLNEGMAGDSISAGYYWRLDERVFPKKPNVLFVMFGINDLNWGRDLSAKNRETFLRHTEMTVQKAFDSGIRDVYVLTYPAMDFPLEGSDPVLCAKIPEVTEAEDSPLQKLGDEAIARAGLICSKEGRCGKGIDIERPMRKVLQESRPLNLRYHDIDGVHLNARGNQLVAELILKGLGEPADQVEKFLKNH
jgi:lysophospholipase L1-like esterase